MCYFRDRETDSGDSPVNHQPENIMGIMETLIEKADAVIAALNENTKARLAGGGEAPAAAVTEKKPRANSKAAAADAPKVTEAQLVAKFDEIKGDGNDEATMKGLKKVIADAGFAKLVELRQAPAKFDEAYAALEALEASLSASADEDDL